MQENNAPRPFLVRWGPRLLGAVLLAALLFGGYRGYGAWRKHHLAAQMQQFVARGDYQSAVLVARRLLVLDEDNLVACRAMAEMAENAGRSEALTWRRKIAQLVPDVPAHQLTLARTALRFAQPDLAQAVLDRLPESARETAEYHQIAGAEALVHRHPARAERHFLAAHQLDPQDPGACLNLAIIRLASADPNVVLDARKSLASLTEQKPARVGSLRALVADSLAHGDRATAQKWAAQLQNEEGITFSDSFLCFHAFEGTDAAAPAFAKLQTRAAAAPESTAELITWLNRNELALPALHWSSTLPKEITDVHPVPLAIAESHSFRQDWEALRAHVEGKNWKEFEALRLAVLSHALHRLSPPDHLSMGTQTAWRAALKAAQFNPVQLLAIAQLAEGWGYQAKAEEAWWAIASRNENARLALSALQRLYKAKQDSRGLLRVAKRALELHPSDLVAANNCASLGILLNGDNTARRLAAKLHADHPANRAFAATHAYALHTEGKHADALQVIESLKEEELRHPSIAAYYVVMLVANGKLERARSFLVHAKRAALLPEEQALLTAATQRLLEPGEKSSSTVAEGLGLRWQA